MSIRLLTILLILGGIASNLFAQSEQDFQRKVMEAHNDWRDEVGVDPLAWSQPLADSAKSWAELLSVSGCFLENSSMPYGENSIRSTISSFSVSGVIDSWGFESDYYDIETNECAVGSYCGHYKQMVWERTTEVGCAMVQCEDYVIFICMYNPPGNYQGVRPYGDF